MVLMAAWWWWPPLDTGWPLVPLVPAGVSVFFDGLLTMPPAPEDGMMSKAVLGTNGPPALVAELATSVPPETAAVTPVAVTVLRASRARVFFLCRSDFLLSAHAA